ncbi:hypothetical protein AB6Q13_07660 [Ralstonia solanacearum]|uniref:hypothetical protein n=1 Tax=Ralstonia solanacearum TaxID=305 RepID=UPI0023056E58|nr:hypothetical protein [Ralstonia solanacearum]MDB0566915.1 hypothetical protein [Ralstonia solanacearum]MDB0576646.1 hypothetical protein [Ralstonia solanacearum]
MRFDVSERSWVGALVGGFVGGMAIATVWHFNPQKDFWDILTAVGTVGATGAALYLASKDGRRRDREAHDRASLAAASLTLRLGAIYLEITDLQKEMAGAGVADCSPTSFAGWHQRLKGIDWISTEEIAPLIPLGQGCAPAIAGGQDRLQIAKRLLSMFAASTGIHMSEVRKQQAAHFAKIIGEATGLLEHAAKECEKVALVLIDPLVTAP